MLSMHELGCNRMEGLIRQEKCYYRLLLPITALLPPNTTLLPPYYWYQLLPLSVLETEQTSAVGIGLMSSLDRAPCSRTLRRGPRSLVGA